MQWFLIYVPGDIYIYIYIYICWYFVIPLYTTRVKCIITLLSLHVSAFLGHHQVTNVYNYNIKDIPIQRIRCHNRCIILYYLYIYIYVCVCVCVCVCVKHEN
jgi:hypothetical protein